jgi:hypothetical protein
MKILDIPRSGSYAGITSSHNRAGQYIRNRRTPTNTQTSRRTAIRSAFGAASSAWSALTVAEQAAWAAAAVSHPITDRLGQSITLTGSQLYVSVNTALQNAGASTTSTAPSDFSVFGVSGSTGSFSLTTGIALVPPGSGTSSDYLLVSFGVPTSAGRTFWKRFTQQQVTTGDSASVAVTTADYEAVFGTPVVGQKVFTKLTPVSQYGVTGTPAVFAMVVAS